MSLFGNAGVEAAVWTTWRLLGKMDSVVLLFLFFLEIVITCILCGSEVTSGIFTSCHMIWSYLNEIETFLKLGGHYHVTPWTHRTNRSFIYLFVFDVMLYQNVALGFIFMTWILSTSCDVMVQTNDIVWNAFKCFYWEKTGLVTEAAGWTKPSCTWREDVHLKLWNIEFYNSQSPY